MEMKKNMFVFYFTILLNRNCATIFPTLLLNFIYFQHCHIAEILIKCCIMSVCVNCFYATHMKMTSTTLFWLLSNMISIVIDCNAYFYLIMQISNK